VVTLPAHLVATPVLERLAGLPGVRSGGRGGEPGGRLQVNEREGRLHYGEVEGVVLGIGATAAWVDLDGFVVAITTREGPLLPNAIALAAGSGALAGAGAGSGGTARLGPGRMTLGSLQFTWDPAAPPSWDPTVPVPEGVTLPAVAARGAALLRALGAEGAVDNHENQFPRSATLTHVQNLARTGLATANDPDGAAGLALLFRAVRERDPEPAGAAVRALLGRGPGLTPEGDDLLAAVAGSLAVLGPALYPPAPPREPPPPDRFRSKEPPPPHRVRSKEPPPPDGFRSEVPPEPPGEPLLGALTPLPGRTTALSATLLALAATRRLPEPAGRLLDLSPAGEKAWPVALARLERLGHGSGRAYAAGIAVTASLLGAAAPSE